MVKYNSAVNESIYKKFVDVSFFRNLLLETHIER
jgi:hypothetical protein